MQILLAVEKIGNDIVVRIRVHKRGEFDIVKHILVVVTEITDRARVV